MMITSVRVQSPGKAIRQSPAKRSIIGFRSAPDSLK
jgi:hypothetical protein